MGCWVGWGGGWWVGGGGGGEGALGGVGGCRMTRNLTLWLSPRDEELSALC